ncbi:MAG: glycoside hydrolase family 28 protein [Cyclobacteriaceae bacterium]|nr:glycoside hydrolase family 28 protein [Cyclobacteriaceae bacterium]
MKRKLLVLLSLVFIWNACSNKSAPIAADPWKEAEIILARIVPPSFPDMDFLITDFGAVNDGATDCTEAFRKAIEACHTAGGGRVVVPEGKFLTGAIHLKSNVNLHVSKGAVVLFSQDPQKYLPQVYTRFEAVELMNYSPLIYAYEQENIAVTGEGELNGQADDDHWWYWKGKWGHAGANREAREHQQKPANERLKKMAEDGVPVSERIFGDGDYLRPSFVQPYKCKNVLIEGVTIKDSPMWVLHPVLSENVTIRNVTVISHGPNSDGCDPESSKDVLIEGCVFDTGDDCIAIKSGRDHDGRRVNVPSENIIVRNCIMKDGHGGVVIGSEISGNVSNVFAENCEMSSPYLDRALRLKSNSRRGGIIENIYMRNVTIGDVDEAVVHVYMFYANETGDNHPVVRNIQVKNVTSKKSQYGICIEAEEDYPVEDIVIEDCSFDNVSKGNVLKGYRGLKVKNVKINGEEFLPDPNIKQ